MKRGQQRECKEEERADKSEVVRRARVLFQPLTSSYHTYRPIKSPRDHVLGVPNLARHRSFQYFRIVITFDRAGKKLKTRHCLKLDVRNYKKMTRHFFLMLKISQNCNSETIN